MSNKSRYGNYPRKPQFNKNPSPYIPKFHKGKINVWKRVLGGKEFTQSDAPLSIEGQKQLKVSPSRMYDT